MVTLELLKSSRGIPGNLFRRPHSGRSDGLRPVWRRASSLVASPLLLFPSLLQAAESTSHVDPATPLLLVLLLILGTAKLASELFERIGQPAVLGELFAGIVLGNLSLFVGIPDFLAPLRGGSSEDWGIAIQHLAALGVIILLFEVGLESTVREMMKVGPSSLLVALLGVIAPFALGFGTSWFFIRELPGQLTAAPEGFSLNLVHLFVGAVLCATSVGITARVLKDLGKLQTKESRIILGAAVIDDVLGLIVLAVVSGLVRAAQDGRPLEIASLARLISVSLGFLIGALLAGVYLVPRLMTQLARLRTSGAMLISALAFAFGMSYLASLAGLAAIVGAFAAGLVLEEVHFRGFREEITIEKLLRPVAQFLVPIFFVLMGIQVRLETFAEPSILGLAAGLTVAAVLGKQVCSLGVLERGLNRLTVGIGMIPRGEVGLIFAGIGRNLGIVDDGTFSAIVMMVIVTTVITPPLLKLTLPSRKRAAS